MVKTLNEEVASAIQEQGGPTISGTYIWLLRKGQRDNPSMKHLEALASFFGVPPAYFFDDAIAAQLGAHLDLRAASRDASVRDIALRAAELSPDSLDAIRGMIDQVRQPITAHAHGPRGIADAVAAGMDGIEHVSFFTEHGVEADWRVVDAMARAGTFVGATEAWLPEGAMLAPHLRDRLEQRSANFARMHGQGVRLVCCSDAGAGPRKPHGVLPRGIIHFGSIGLTNREALASATTVAAEACNVADRKGRIAAGYDADLVAVAGNPLQRLEAVLDVRSVFRMGRLVQS